MLRAKLWSVNMLIIGTKIFINGNVNESYYLWQHVSTILLSSRGNHWYKNEYTDAYYVLCVVRLIVSLNQTNKCTRLLVRIRYIFNPYICVGK